MREEVGISCPTMSRTANQFLGESMSKKISSLLLSLLLVIACAANTAFARNNQDQHSAAAKSKQEISKLGVDAFVTVRLDDGRKVSGRIGEIGDDTFALLVPVKGDRTAKLTDRIVISYAEVKQVKSEGSSGGANLGPAFLVAGAVILLIVIAR
jgi:hypothetical protein